MSDGRIYREEQMLAYQSYDAAWGVPIFYPLILGLVSQTILYWSHFAHKRRSPSILAAVMVETFFCIVCLVSCIMNRAARDYVGNAGMCLWQGFYSTWYNLAGMSMFVWNFYLVARSNPLDRKRELAVICAIVLVFSVILACFPLWGVMQYMFAKDFCMFNIQENGWAVIFTMMYIGSLLAMGLILLAHSDKYVLGKILTIVYFMVFYLPIMILAAYALDQKSAIENATYWYAIMAVTIHSNQIFIPILYGWLWTYQGIPSLKALKSKDEDTDESETSRAKMVPTQKYGKSDEQAIADDVKVDME